MSEGKITLTVKDVDFSNVNEDAIINAIAVQVSKGFQKLGVHVADVATSRAPVSAERNFNPRKFVPVKVKPVGTFGLETGSDASKRASRLFEIRNYSSRERGELFRKAFGNATTSENATRFFEGTGKFKGQTPSALRIGKGGAIVGAFKHQPGTLKKSIKFDGIRREGNKVIATIRAHAPYAWYVHEGFTHKGGGRVQGPKFLLSALDNIRSRLTDASTYEG